VHKQTEEVLDTNGSEGGQEAKWIFVIRSSKKLFAGKVCGNANWV